MKIIALADLHGDLGRLPALAPVLEAADVVLLAGDLTHFGRAQAAQAVIAPLRRHSRRLFAVSGNCDYPEVEDYLAREGIGLHARHELVEGIAFLGVGGSLPCPGRTPNERPDDEFALLLERAAAGLGPHLALVLLSHQPPFDTITDLAYRGGHAGSEAVREFLASRQPLACFTGHIHEGRGQDAVGRTVVANPGPLRWGGYTYAEITAGRLAALEIRQLPA